MQKGRKVESRKDDMKEQREIGRRKTGETNI
jgi:hypothetical protein